MPNQQVGVQVVNGRCAVRLWVGSPFLPGEPLRNTTVTVCVREGGFSSYGLSATDGEGFVEYDLGVLPPWVKLQNPNVSVIAGDRSKVL